MYKLRVKTHFDAAHYIRDYEGKCNREHGHRWEVEVIISGEKLDSKNILVDFSLVKKLLDILLDTYLDHYQLNERLGDPNVTAELLSKWIFDKIALGTRANGLELESTTVWESPDCGAEYS